ncbi:7-carboxy-7-deazaguanine synthase [Reinekea thalattae]|uniref:7-carboxy-7-deazaguanine synthase n=1 Tax=Reinekea thalattae TaxID=2593301 RepID=A0A5C8Z6M0_9GAMM|nr:7-carboxy-7-deazaguanine synthase [Reinekea thalattae]TXR53277.1 7-carboxy-7-deazaguanine synthase [Reinekea thalattae]
MAYSVKEMFYSLQGEGHHSGRPSIFCRFAGCNLWNGKEASREQSVCSFCDTDFIGTDGQNGGKFRTEQALVEAIEALWPEQAEHKYVVFTGGEPALQLTNELIIALQKRGFECAVESNGTLPLPSQLDWVCISPKGSAEITVTECDELKLVFPQEAAMPERFTDIKARYRYLSPLNDWQQSTLIFNSNTQATIDYCLAHPQWRLTLQSHKILHID